MNVECRKHRRFAIHAGKAIHISLAITMNTRLFHTAPYC